MTDESDMKPTAAIPVSDVSEMPEADREVIARFEAALHGARPAPGSDEAAAVTAMNCFVNELRDAQTVARNAGLDLTCKACSSVFLTGALNGERHTATCATVPEVRVPIDA
jgi:hypothetical protein